jgi:hypothetical protein
VKDLLTDKSSDILFIFILVYREPERSSSYLPMSGNDCKPRRKCKGRLQVAIIGGGPAGLGLAIELASLPFVDWHLYEKKPMISETGGGISLQPTTLRLLENNGAAKYITATDIYRSSEGKLEQRRWVPYL